MRAYIVIAVSVLIGGRITTSASGQTNTCGSIDAVSGVPSFTSFIRDTSSPLNGNRGLASLHNSKTYFGVSTYKCAASLISNQYLITAAHCMPDAYGVIGIVLGRENLTEEALPKNTYEIAEKFVHPDYSPSENKEYGDIALLRTNRKVIFDSKIWPYCLPNKGQIYEDYQLVQILGWGQVDQLWKVSPVVKKAYVKIVENKRCKAIWIQEAPTMYEKIVKKFSYPHGLTNALLCAGKEDAGSCKGDSGGPMSIQTSDGLSRLIGVISKGINCPQEINTPGFYANVAFFIDWIIEITGLPKPVSIMNESTDTSTSTGEEPHWCSLISSPKQCSDLKIAMECKTFCSVVSEEEPFWCSLISSPEQCSDLKIARECKTFCSVGSAIPACQGTEVFPVGSQCFRLFKDNYSWEAANTKCLSQNLVLAEPIDDEAAVLLRKIMVEKFGPYAESWIGGRADGTKLVFQRSGRVLLKDSPYLNYGRGNSDAMSTGYCLELDAWQSHLDANPERPYDVTGCAYNYNALCEVV